MAQASLHDGTQIPTLATSYIPTPQLPRQTCEGRVEWTVQYDGRTIQVSQGRCEQQQAQLNLQGLGSTGKGILIGMLSAFGSAALVTLIIAIVYFFRYTNRGRILLDRIGRPGEFDDEQQFQREEEEAVGEMDDSQRAEYLRAKG